MRYDFIDYTKDMLLVYMLLEGTLLVLLLFKMLLSQVEIYRKTNLSNEPPKAIFHARQYCKPLLRRALFIFRENFNTYLNYS
jgi:hypothetical protein